MRIRKQAITKLIKNPVSQFFMNDCTSVSFSYVTNACQAVEVFYG